MSAMNDLREKRNRDFRNIYRKTIEDLGDKVWRMTSEDLIRLTLSKPAPMLYIDEERICRIISDFINRPRKHYMAVKEQAKKNTSKSMYMHITRLASEYFYTHDIDIKEAARYVQNQPAPSFFISYRTARDYIINDYYDRKIKKAAKRK